MNVTKRDCSEDVFDKSKITNAILKAMKNGSGIYKPEIAESIADEIEQECSDQVEIDIYDIEEMVFRKLIDKGEILTARAYEGYKSIRAFQRDNDNTTDKQIEELLNGNNSYWNDENSNKNPRLSTTQRDYMAGIVSTDMTRRFLLPPEIVQAHDEGLIHFHDADYFAQFMHNCFHKNTEFITADGIKSFADFRDGEVTMVMDKDGVFRNATVKKYGKQKMYEVTFKTSQREKTVICTSNHRWILKDGAVTTELKVGDTLLGLTKLSDDISNDFRSSEMFAIGFLIEDGCDHKNTNQHQIRLCGDKKKYAEIIKRAGYDVIPVQDTDDLIAYKKGHVKQDFLNNQSWKYLSADDKRNLFLGLYAADGTVSANKLCTTDERIAQLVRDTSFCAGYHITSETIEVRDTEYKANSELIAFRFTRNQPDNLCWKVSSISIYRSDNEEYDAWCVEEPVTHSFTLEGGMITGNCDLVNLEDMLQNGTVISETLIEKPHSFSTACNIATQIIAQVASSQYGGQSVSLAHLAPFVDVSRQKIRKKTVAWVENTYLEIRNKPFRYSKNKAIALMQRMTNAKQRHKQKQIEMAEHFKRNVDIEKMVEADVLEEIKRGIQTIQYQVVTLMTTNGQAPFLTVFMYLNEAKNEQEKADLALLIEETLNQRFEGVKNEQGVWISPAFPKLIYVLEPDNITEDSKYWYLTKLAAKCSSKRLVPDYISEKIMLENKIDSNGVGHCYTCMGCRSFLTPYVDNDGNPKYYGRFNQGVVTINLVDVALSSGGNIDKFWELLEERTELCHRALRLRHERLLGTSSDVAPILWRYGALSRLEKGETIDKLLFGGYSTISLGYAGLYECVKYMTGCNHSDESVGEKFGLEVMQALNDKCTQWKEAENIAYSLYGTPLESTTYKFANCLKDRFGKDVFEKLDGHDRNYITNSYHIPVFEEIDPFEKLRIEAKFQKLSPGGAISYIETADMQNNLDAVLEVLKFIYDNIMYAELNTKSDYCQVCGYDGEISLIDEDGKLIWECPHCHNRDPKRMNVTRRTCGYIGTATNGWNQGRLGDIHDRFIHLDNLISKISNGLDKILGAK